MPLLKVSEACCQSMEGSWRLSVAQWSLQTRNNWVSQWGLRLRKRSWKPWQYWWAYATSSHTWRRRRKWASQCRRIASQHLLSRRNWRQGRRAPPSTSSGRSWASLWKRWPSRRWSLCISPERWTWSRISCLAQVYGRTQRCRPDCMGSRLTRYLDGPPSFTSCPPRWLSHRCGELKVVQQVSQESGTLCRKVSDKRKWGRLRVIGFAAWAWWFTWLWRACCGCAVAVAADCGGRQTPSHCSSCDGNSTWISSRRSNSRSRRAYQPHTRGITPKRGQNWRVSSDEEDSGGEGRAKCSLHKESGGAHERNSTWARRKGRIYDRKTRSHRRGQWHRRSGGSQRRGGILRLRRGRERARREEASPLERWRKSWMGIRKKFPRRGLGDRTCGPGARQGVGSGTRRIWQSIPVKSSNPTSFELVEEPKEKTGSQKRGELPGGSVEAEREKEQEAPHRGSVWSEFLERSDRVTKENREENHGHARDELSFVIEVADGSGVGVENCRLQGWS